MRIVVTSSGADLDAPASPVFGRCQTYVFVDTETMETEAVANPAIGAASGAGIRAAQFVIEHGAQALVTGNVGPNAFSVFQSAGITIYPFGGGTVRRAVEAFETGQLQSIADATAQAGQGMGPGMDLDPRPSMGIGRGQRLGRGMGMGMGLGRRAGMGRGRGRGMMLGMGATMQPGLNTSRTVSDAGAGTQRPPQASVSQLGPTHEEAVAALKETARQLQGQLAQVLERLEQLQSET
jgi:predicted Fe-Mo cluster-binding NifX family protein